MPKRHTPERATVCASPKYDDPFLGPRDRVEEPRLEGGRLPLLLDLLLLLRLLRDPPERLRFFPENWSLLGHSSFQWPRSLQMAHRPRLPGGPRLEERLDPRLRLPLLRLSDLSRDLPRLSPESPAPVGRVNPLAFLKAATFSFAVL